MKTLIVLAVLFLATILIDNSNENIISNLALPDNQLEQHRINNANWLEMENTGVATINQ